MEVILPSKAVLKIQIAPFAVAKALYQSMLKELKAISVTSQTEMASIYKDLFCVGFSSPEVEDCLWKCFERCTINGLKIDADTFEPVERRDDYIQACIEVAKANVFPFVKSLYAEYQRISAMIENSQA